MSTSPDLSFLHKRDGVDDLDLPAGAVAGIVLGVLAIVAASIWCCCPCWKKRGLRTKGPGLDHNDKREDFGKERGLDSDASHTSSKNKALGREPSARSTIISPMSTGNGSQWGMQAGDRSTIVSALSTGNRTVHGNELEGRSYNEGFNEVDGQGLGAREMDGAPRLHEVHAQGLAPPPHYEQIQRKPLVAELPAELPSSYQRPEKI